MYCFETGVCANSSRHMVLGASLNPRSQATAADWRNNCILRRNAACAVVFPAIPGSGGSISARRPSCRAGYTDPYWPPAESDVEEEQPVDEATKWAGLFKEPVYDNDRRRVKKSTDKFFNQIFPRRLINQRKRPERLETKFKELQKVVKTLGTEHEEGIEEPAESSFSAVVAKLRVAERRRKKSIKIANAEKWMMIQARQAERETAAAQEERREFVLSDFAGVKGGDFEDFENEGQGEGEFDDEFDEEAEDYVESDSDDSGSETGYSTDDLIGAYSKDELLEDFSSDDLRTDADEDEFSDEDWEDKQRESTKRKSDVPKVQVISPPVYFSQESDIAKMNDLAQLTVTQLRNMCKVRKITGYTKKKKDELVALLSADS